jgi:hypothetical protein
MKRLKNCGLVLVILFSLLGNNVFAQAQSQGGLDPRMKALGLMAAYGAIGGFLLGTASLAFDTPGRAPFIGASLGLYAGMLFGGYIVVSHAMKKYQMQNPGAGEDGYYPETPSSPYESPFSGGGYNSGEESGQRGQHQTMELQWELFEQSSRLKSDLRFPSKKSRDFPLLFVPLINLNF